MCKTKSKGKMNYNATVAQLFMKDPDAARWFVKNVSRGYYDDGDTLSRLFAWDASPHGRDFWSDLHYSFDYRRTSEVVLSEIDFSTIDKYVFDFDVLIALLEQVNKGAADYVIDNISNVSWGAKSIDGLFVWSSHPGFNWLLIYSDDIPNFIERKRMSMKTPDEMPLISGEESIRPEDKIFFYEPHQTGGDSKVTLTAHEAFVWQMRKEQFLKYLAGRPDLADPEFDLFHYVLDVFMTVHFAKRVVE